VAVSPTALTYTCGGSGNVSLTANIYDPSSIASATGYSAFWRDGASSAASPLASVTMQFYIAPGPGGTLRTWWGATIDASYSGYYLGGYNGWLQYYVGATDKAGNTGYSGSGWIYISAYPCVR
jgi:hypothetical protein